MSFRKHGVFAATTGHQCAKVCDRRIGPGRSPPAARPRRGDPVQKVPPHPQLSCQRPASCSVNASVTLQLLEAEYGGARSPRPYDPLACSCMLFDRISRTAFPAYPSPCLTVVVSAVCLHAVLDGCRGDGAGWISPGPAGYWSSCAGRPIILETAQRACIHYHITYESTGNS